MKDRKRKEEQKWGKNGQTYRENERQKGEGGRDPQRE